MEFHYRAPVSFLTRPLLTTGWIVGRGGGRCIVEGGGVRGEMSELRSDGQAGGFFEIDPRSEKSAPERSRLGLSCVNQSRDR